MSTPISLITPIPGDPEQVRRVSAQLATVEARAREIESRLRAIETGVGPQMWRGQAADGFAALLAETGPDLTRLATSYGAASQALATYAIELAAAQDAARAAEVEASAATGDRDRGSADRDSAEADAFRHAATADEARVRLDPAAAQDADQRRAAAVGRANAASAAVEQAERALQAARQKADQAAGQRAFDDDFVFDPDAEAILGDYLSWAEWGAKLHGAPLLRPDLDDSLELYAHYRDGTGTPMRVDYEEAYREDEMIRNAVDAEIAAAMQWAELLHRETGQTSFSVSGDAVQPRYYPETENWQKTLGGHTIWGSGDVRIEGNTVTMEVTIHAEDRYNFNRGEEDIATGAPDEANGRFAELGWAKSFDVSGSVTRTVTWELGSDQPPIMEGGGVDREPGGEDRIDGRGSSQ